MSNHERRDPEDGIGDLTEALRAEVPVRPEWRAAVLREIESLPPPRRTDVAIAATSWRRRRWVLSPLTAIAAGVVCVMIGIGAAMTILQPDDSSLPSSASAAPGETPGALASTSSSGSTSIRFVIVAANASSVSLVGDFNDWNPGAMPMRRLGEGDAWVRDVVLEPGRHVYAFYVDGALQVDPAAPRAAEDDFGIPSSALIVRNVRQ